MRSTILMPWRSASRLLPTLMVAGLLVLAPGSGQALQSPLELATIYAQSLDRRLTVPAEDAQRYGTLIVKALKQAGLTRPAPQ